ncbi:Cu/Zn superoxide dismutase-like protein [Venturia nashicola]|uniref:superoxide dismutase n=1 Tax=Venturia nashicola TaxID=86259 RepID=A0A4Z1NYV4_9PEZI|nr:Cu/Zn superoxide dismutase-like protein [Venturia nashicola]
MRSSTVLAGLSTIALASAQVSTGQLGDALRNTDDPMGAVYQADIPVGRHGDVVGSITATAAGDKGTNFQINFAGLPTSGGPFGFHIHVNPVADDDNCSSTLGHLDPFLRGEAIPCTASRPETCQVGDLSGKYGKANGTTYMASFFDPYVSLKEGMGAFFGNRSFVIHFANKTRIACANFENIGGVEDAPTTALPPNEGNNATATLVPAPNAGNSSGEPLNGVVTLTTTSLAQPTPTASSSVSDPASASPTPSGSAGVPARDVAGTFSLLGALAVGLFVL